MFTESLDFKNYHYRVKVTNCPNCRVEDVQERGCLLYPCDLHDKLLNQGDRLNGFFTMTQIPKADWETVYP